MSAYLVFIVVNLVILLAGISGSAVSVAFPNLTVSLNTSLVLAGWVMSGYQLVAMASMVLMGKVSDAFGRRKTFLLCLSFFTVGSLFAALAPNVQLLILARIVQGIGGGGFIPSVVAIVADQFPHSRQKAIGLAMSIFPIGQVIGPNLGGWLVSAFGWRSIFWFNVPLGLAACIPIAMLLHSQKTRESHIDFTGAGLFTASLFALMIGISEIGSSNATLSWALVGLLFAASIVLMVMFIRHEMKAKDPIIDLVVLKRGPFVAANAYSFIYGVCAFGAAAFIPLYAVSVYNMSIFESGLVLAARSIGMILASFVASFLLMRWGYRWPMLLGTFALTISFALLGVEPSHVSILGAQFSNLTIVSIITLLSGLGMGIAAPAASNAGIDLMPQRVGTITGVRGMFRQAGGAINIAITTLLLEAIGDMSRGFHFIFLGMAAFILVTLPAIFGMPERATP